MARPGYNRGMFKSIRKILRGGDYQSVTASAPNRQRLSGKGLRIPIEGQAFQVEMGKQILHLVPDQPLSAQAASGELAYRCYDPARFERGIHHSLRAEPGKKLSVDHRRDLQRLVFSQPKDAFRRHLQIKHEGDALVFRDPISELGTYISVLDDPQAANALNQRREDNARRLLTWYGGPIEPLAQDSALQQLNEVNESLRQDPYRELDSLGNVGGLLQLPGFIRPVIIGDLHGNIDNLLKILCENAFLEELEAGTAALLFLGDAVHAEEEGHLEDMDSSVMVMDLILSLKAAFPRQVFFLIGNHDSYSPDVMKGGVPQAVLWEKHLARLRGEAYTQALSLFYRQSPLVALSPDFLACHAGPPRRKTSREMLIEARQVPELVHELTWNRLKTKGFPMGYKRGDVKRFRKHLDLPEEHPFIVAHFPQDGKNTVWENVADIPAHHIVYSARAGEVAVFTCVDHQMLPIVMKSEPMRDAVNRRFDQTM